MILFKTLKIGLLFLAFYFIPVATAYPLLNYQQKNFKVTNREYNRYVKPQFKNILRDFYYMTEKLDGSIKDFVDINKEIRTLLKQSSKLSESCANLDEVCNDFLDAFYKKMRKLSYEFLELQEKAVEIAYYHLVDESFVLINQFSLEWLNIKLKGDIPSEVLFLEKKIAKFFSNLETIYRLLMIKKLDTTYGDEFGLVWFDFIHKIEHIFMDRKIEPTLLLSHLGQLNLAWNSFHMQVTKTNRGLSKITIRRIDVILQRWNSILKLVFGR